MRSLLLACLLGSVAGCARPIIGDYVVRQGRFQYGGFEGNHVVISECVRNDATGDLTDCRRLRITFE